MDEGGQRDHKRHRMYNYNVPPWDVNSQYQMKEENAFCVNAKITMLCDERDAAMEERDRALAEKKAAFDERDVAIQQRDAAILERDNTMRERDNAIAALQFQESTINALLRDGGRGLKCGNHPSNSHPTNISAANGFMEKCSTAVPLSSIPNETAKSHQVKRSKANKNVTTKPSKSPKKVKRDDLNRHITTDGSKAEWDAQDFGSLNQIHFDESTMPVPICSCTGVPRQCYRWGNGGWQSSCCTTSLSVYPLPLLPNKRHARMGGRKMSGSVFNRLLSKLAATGHDLSTPLDLKSYWAKHGTNRYITIK